MNNTICTLDQFKNFFLLKAFDIIGNGTFKKHLSKCKETNDPWAINMTNDVQQIQTILKDLYTKVSELPSTPNNIPDICRDIMSSAQPPIRMFAGTVTCSITNKKVNQCLDFSKIHKKDKHIFVDAKFSHFFLFLWYTNKIEYIIRSYVRNWIFHQSETNFKKLCDIVQIDLEEKIIKMYNLFCLAYSHVICSINKMINSHLHRIII
jgi:hypothetical protein